MAKGARYAMLLQCLSKSAQGIPMRLIHQLYQTVVIPHTLYAASIWLCPTYNAKTNTTVRGSKGTTKKIAHTQQTAMITITGAMRSSPSDSLEVHANLLPGPLLVQHILHNSLLHISTLLNHHPLNAIMTHIAKCGPVKRHKTALHHLLQNLAVNPLMMEVTHPCPVHPVSSTPFNTSIAPSKEAAIADFYRCTNHTTIFTNGSSTSGKVGVAASLYVDFTHVVTLQYHLGKDTEHTVFEAEVVGLILAARLLLSRNEATFPATIFVNNQAVIRSGVHPTAKPGHYLLLHFRKLVRHLQDEKDLENTSINLNWIAGHANIEGNELADRKAKLAALKKDKASPRRELPKLLRHPLPFSTSAVKQAHEDSLQKRW